MMPLSLPSSSRRRPVLGTAAVEADAVRPARLAAGRIQRHRTAGRAGLLRIALHRYSGLRWIAAAGAAVVAFSVLDSGPADSGADTLSDTDAMLAEKRLASRLPTATRGVSIPTAVGTLAPGDRVDVHEVESGIPVVSNVLVVGVTEEDTLIAVPRGQVGAVVDSMAAGGVILVLVPGAEL